MQFRNKTNVSGHFWGREHCVLSDSITFTPFHIYKSLLNCSMKNKTEIKTQQNKTKAQLLPRIDSNFRMDLSNAVCQSFSTVTHNLQIGRAGRSCLGEVCGLAALWLTLFIALFNPHQIFSRRLQVCRVKHVWLLPRVRFTSFSFTLTPHLFLLRLSLMTRFCWYKWSCKYNFSREKITYSKSSLIYIT